MRKAMIVLAVMLVSAACAKSSTTTSASGSAPSVLVTGMPNSVQGNQVSFQVTASGITIVKANGDTSGKTGHYHVFVDRDPVAVGQVIPKEPGIVHSADNPVIVRGLTVGTHTFHLVLGDGTHKRITNVDETFTVDVKGPSVRLSGPSTIPAGTPLTLRLSSEGVQIVKANGDTSGKTGHYHVIVDPSSEPEENALIPPAVPNKIIHTTENTVTINGLSKGEHDIWLWLGDGTHHAWPFDVVDRMTVTVT